MVAGGRQRKESEGKQWQNSSTAHIDTQDVPEGKLEGQRLFLVQWARVPVMVIATILQGQLSFKRLFVHPLFDKVFS
jgi:hypothetical protein